MIVKLVRTPVPGVNDTVGKVTFADGVAKVADDATELAYFRSAGYQIDDFDEALGVAKEYKDDSAVEDLEGLVEQQGAQEDDPQVVRDVDGDGVDEVLPRKSASTDVWRRFAVEHGMSEDDANAKSRDELVAHFAEDDDKQEEAL